MSLKRVTVKADEMASVMMIDKTFDVNTPAYRFNHKVVLRIDFEQFKEYLTGFIKARNVTVGTLKASMVDYTLANETFLISTYLRSVALALGKDYCMSDAVHEQPTMFEWTIPYGSNAMPRYDSEQLATAANALFLTLQEAGYDVTDFRSMVGKDKYADTIISLFCTGLFSKEPWTIKLYEQAKNSQYPTTYTIVVKVATTHTIYNAVLFL